MAPEAQKQQRRNHQEKLRHHGNVTQVRINHIGHGQAHGRGDGLPRHHHRRGHDLKHEPHHRANANLHEHLAKPRGAEGVHEGPVVQGIDQKGQHQR